MKNPGYFDIKMSEEIRDGSFTVLQVEFFEMQGINFITMINSRALISRDRVNEREPS